MLREGGRPRHGRRTLATAMWPGPATARDPRDLDRANSRRIRILAALAPANRRISGGFTVEANLGRPPFPAHDGQRNPNLTDGPSISDPRDLDRANSRRIRILAALAPANRRISGGFTVEANLGRPPFPAHDGQRNPNLTDGPSISDPRDLDRANSRRIRILAALAPANRRISGGFTVEANLGRPPFPAHDGQRNPNLTDGPSISDPRDLDRANSRRIRILAALAPANRRISGGFTVEANLGRPPFPAHDGQRNPNLTDGPSISGGFTVEANLGRPPFPAHDGQRNPNLTDGPSISAVRG